MNKRSLLYNLLFFFSVFTLFLVIYISQRSRNHFYGADDRRYKFTGRFDHSTENEAKVWAPGAYIEFKFLGSYCDVVIEDEYRHFNKHNYILVILDNNPPKRIRLTDYYNQIKIGKGLDKGEHTVLICKTTESYFGYINFLGAWCKDLVKYKKKEKLLFEFIGDSITCGSGADTIPPDSSGDNWSDLENAYVSYGSVLSRRYRADRILSSVSGIGLTSSFTESDKNMPEMYPRISLDEHAGEWNFNDAKEPDIVFITLGQNDGLQKIEKFTNTYIQFVRFIRLNYKHSKIICCNSPMSEPKLRHHLNLCVQRVVKKLRNSGFKNVHGFYYKGKYNSGHKKHPSKYDHLKMANELQDFLEKLHLENEKNILELRKNWQH